MNATQASQPDFFEALVSAVADRVTEQLLDELRGQGTLGGGDEPYIRVKEAAEYLGNCSEKRIRNLTSQGRLRHVKDGSLTLTKKSWIDDSLNEGTSNE